jgi:hypothetical protein
MHTAKILVKRRLSRRRLLKDFAVFSDLVKSGLLR